MTQPRELLMIGLPESGKTTFLAALYDVVETAAVPGALQLAKIPDTRDYLNTIRRRWLSCEPQDHTRAGVTFKVALSLFDPKSTTTAEVVFPDVFGELFNQHYAHREWAKEYDELVGRVTGILLFVHPDKIRHPDTIRDRQELRQELKGTVPGAGGASQVSASTQDQQDVIAPPPEWSPEMAPTQVELVELLQFIPPRRHVTTELRVAVVVSAWDLVRPKTSAPKEWCRANLPLLDQFLSANSRVYRAAFFGVSAQGGDLATGSDQLLALLTPSDRITVVGDLPKSHDITLPVRWLMGLDDTN